MNSEDLKKRTKEYTLKIIKFVNILPNTILGRTIANQLIRSGTSVGANYRAALRSRSKFAGFKEETGVLWMSFFTLT